MKRKLKAVLLIIAALAGTVFINEVYYVFHGQFRSCEKLEAHQELSRYEMASIYTLHMGLWLFGWPVAPEAAKECMYLHFTDRDTVYFNRSGFYDSKKLEQAYDQLRDKPYGSSVRLTWNGNVDYSPFSPEHRLAIAANPCTFTKVGSLDYQHWDDEILYRITTSTQYPVRSRTEFDFRKFKIVINEGLFRYLQDRGWLGTYTAVYNLTFTAS